MYYQNMRQGKKHMGGNLVFGKFASDAKSDHVNFLEYFLILVWIINT